MVDLNGEYEGDFFRFSGSTSPIEQFITFSASAKLSNSAVLKVAYQILGYNQFAPIDLGGNTGDTSNANVLTTQLMLHF